MSAPSTGIPPCRVVITLQVTVDDTTRLARSINEKHELVLQAARSAVERAIECGKALLEAKKKVGHGAWLKWVSENLSFAERTTTGYMKLAALSKANQQRVADLPLRQALKAIAGPFRQASETEEDQHTEKTQKRAGRKAIESHGRRRIEL